MYRYAAQHQRVLLVSNGFYEWRHIFRLNKRTREQLKTPDKYSYHNDLYDRDYFFWGIINLWIDKSTGEQVETHAAVTTEANALMAEVHNSKRRMLTILKEDLAYEWLFDKKMSEQRIMEIARTQFPWKQMRAYTVAKNIKEAADPIVPFAYPPELVPPIVPYALLRGCIQQVVQYKFPTSQIQT